MTACAVPSFVCEVVFTALLAVKAQLLAEDQETAALPCH